MTFESAVNLSEPDDRLVNEPWFQDFKKSVWKETVLQGACALSDQWQVQKAEPKVLTAEECYAEMSLPGADLEFYQFKTIYNFIMKNGRLERDFEWRSALPIDLSSHSTVDWILKNIKPLKTE